MLLMLQGPLRSYGADLLTVPRTRPKCTEGAFSNCGPVLYNKLSADLRSIRAVFIFENKLKTFYFHRLRLNNCVCVLCAYVNLHLVKFVVFNALRQIRHIRFLLYVLYLLC